MSCRQKRRREFKVSAMRCHCFRLGCIALNIDYEIVRIVIWGLNSCMHEYIHKYIGSICHVHACTRLHVKCVCGQQWTCSVASASVWRRAARVSRKFDDWYGKYWILIEQRARGGSPTHTHTREGLWWARKLVFVYADRDTWVKRRGINHFFPPPRGCHERGAGLYFWSDKFQLSF